MSVFRVITRIIPLNSSESTFEPASFDTLTDGNVGDVKVLNLTEPQSGMKYRIERIEYFQNVGPGETVESVNKAYAEKLKSIPGFVPLTTDDMPLNPYDKSFELTLPKVIFADDESSNAKSTQHEKRSDSFKISVVKNFNFNKPNPSSKKQGVSSIVSKYEKGDGHSDVKSPKGFKTKYPSYLSKKLKNSVWRNKNKASPTKYLKKYPKELDSNKSVGDFGGDDLSVISSTSGSRNNNCPTSNYVQANKDIDARKALDVRISEQDPDGSKSNSLKDGDNIKKSNEDDNKSGGKNESSVDLFDDLEYGELIINVPETTESYSPGENLSENKDSSLSSFDTPTSDKSVLINSSINNNAINGDSPMSDSKSKKNDSLLSTASENDPEESGNCNKYLVLVEHPVYELLMSLKKYFVNGECLICGFIPPDIDYNASVHMESHISTNSFISCFKCSCCEDEKFSNPRNLYLHTLAREKSYNYMCNICLLKFKRKHYLMRHTAKSH